MFVSHSSWGWGVACAFTTGLDCAKEGVEGTAKEGSGAALGEGAVTGTERWNLAMTDFGRDTGCGGGIDPPVCERLRLIAGRRVAIAGLYAVKVKISRGCLP